MATDHTNTICSIKFCSQPAVGEAARTKSLLCQTHLNHDFNRVHTLHHSLTQTVRQQFTDRVNVNALRLKQQSLASHIQLIRQHIDMLHDTIDTWHHIIEHKLEDRSEALLKCLQHITQLQQYEKDVLQSQHEEKDMKKTSELLTEMESAIEETSEQFELIGGVDSVSRDVNSESVTSLGDVSRGVKEMKFVIDRHMRRVSEMCECEDGVRGVREYEEAAESSSSSSPSSSSSSSSSLSAAAAAAVSDKPSAVIDVGAEVAFVTSCSRTDGFVGDKSGRVVKMETLGDEEGVKLPQPCIFVVFWLEEGKDHLLVTSLDGSVNLRYHCDMHWNKWITGIHCDSRRQLLFVAHQKSVTVTDLSGYVTQVISDSSVGHTINCISGIDGDDDKVIVFDSDGKKVFVMNKDTGELETLVTLGDWHGYGSPFSGAITLLDNKILVTDFANMKVHKVCMITNQLVTSYPTHELTRSLGVACDSRGRMFISDFAIHVVRVLLSDGTVVQTLGDYGESGRDSRRFNRPWGLTVIEGTTHSHLVVADCDNKRLIVFDFL